MSFSRINPDELKTNILTKINEYQTVDNPKPTSFFGDLFGGLIDSGRERALNYRAFIQGDHANFTRAVIDDLLNPDGLLKGSTKLRTKVLYEVAHAFNPKLTMGSVNQTVIAQGVVYRQASQGYGPSHEDSVMNHLMGLIRKETSDKSYEDEVELKKVSSDTDSLSFGI